MWLVRNWIFNVILINFNFNNHMWLMATVYCVGHHGCVQFFEDQLIMAVDCTSQTQVCAEALG